MKKRIYIKRALMMATFFVATLLIYSCDDNNKTEDTKAVAEEKNDEKFDKKKKEKDAQFLVNAAEINLKQIQLGQLAQQKGKEKHTKELGRILENDHSKSLNDLTAFAKGKKISIPTAPTDNSKDAYKNLNEKSGNDFDIAYVNMMVNEHKDAIDTYEKASKDCTDADIKNWAKTSLPHLRKHLDRSIKSQKKCDNMYFEKK